MHTSLHVKTHINIGVENLGREAHAWRLLGIVFAKCYPTLVDAALPANDSFGNMST